MKRLYLETTVVIVWLFGSEREPERFRAANQLFRLLGSDKIQGVISMYTLQEIYAFCEANFPQGEAREVAKLAIRRLLETEVELVPLLDRRTRTLESRRFQLPDRSDQPHAIAAWVNHCEALLTYDAHFQAVSQQLRVLSPEEWLEEER